MRRKLTKTRVAAIVAALAVGAAGPSSVIVADAGAKPKKRYCVKYKKVKNKQGKLVKRCAKYKYR